MRAALATVAVTIAATIAAAIAAGGCHFYVDGGDDDDDVSMPPPPAPDASPPFTPDGGGVADAARPLPPDASGVVECAMPMTDCCRACELVAFCTANPARLGECESACEASAYVPTHDAHCLALRILWVDEDGCAAIVPTYLGFDPADDCAD